MSWEERVISEEELSRYLRDPNDQSFIARVNALIEHQKQHWPMLRDGYGSFAAIETKQVDVDGSPIIVQHNPRRVRSTAAAVDEASVKARRCFLCEANLPAEEKGFAYGDLMLMCNPFPVLDRHLSIVHRDHIAQNLAGAVETFLGLAAALSPDYFVLYNGPRCGASAPDHLHFQACSRAVLPIEQTVRSGDPQAHCSACAETEARGFEVFTVTDSGRSLIVFRGNNLGEMSQWVYATLDELSVAETDVEPMVNLIASYDLGRWTVYLFPRTRHRPAVFFAEGENRLTVSPGAIDMAGVLVVPERGHFDRIGAAEALNIFSEVSLGENEVNDLTERICAAMGVEEIG